MPIPAREISVASTRRSSWEYKVVTWQECRFDDQTTSIRHTVLTTRRNFVVASAASLAGLACRSLRLSGVHSSRSLAEFLRHPSDSPMLILNADDIGIAHSVNTAVMTAFDRKAIDSGSVMVPCDAFAEFAAWARTRRSLDVGIHLTLTSSPSARSRPVLSGARVATLVDTDGFFPVAWPATPAFSLREVEAELRAQIDRALEEGIDVTHLDAHQHILQLRGAGMFGVLLRLADDYRLPFRVSRSWYIRAPWLAGYSEKANVPLGHLISPGAADAEPSSWNTWYAERVRAIAPGLNELFMHPGIDNAELRSLLPNERPWGSAWRQRDFNMLFSAELSTALRETGIVRTGWREVRDYLRSL